MAETYRKSKIESFKARLVLRKEHLKKQLARSESADMVPFLKGQLAAIDLIIDELTAEFSLCDETEEDRTADKQG